MPNHKPRSPFLKLLRNRINLREIPFSERGSRLLVFREDDHFSIRLAERWFKVNKENQEAYRQRPLMISSWQLTDESGNPLPLDVTTYPHCIVCETAVGQFVLAFIDADTLLLNLPDHACGMSFQAHLDQARTDRRGGVLRLTGTIRRNIAYTTNARLLRNEISSPNPKEQTVHLQFDPGSAGRCVVLNVTSRLGFNRRVPDPDAALKSSATRWHAWFAAAPAVAEEYRSQYYYAWWIMRAGLISSRFYTTREAMTPSKTHYVGVWQWDNFFHALAFRHVDPVLAQDQLRVLLDHQRDDGMIPDAVHDEGIVTSIDHPIAGDVTKPPLIGWAAWKLFEHTADRDFLDEIYEPVVRCNNWWAENNDLDHSGLCEYHHPYSSGLDNSPLWDEGMPVESPDLNTYLCLQQEALGKIAGVIGETADASRWARSADALAARLIDQQWDETAGLFWATRNGSRINVRTPFNLFPLITGRMPQSIADRLVAHLTNEDEFWTHYPVPSVAIDDPHFDPSRMWRGPTWVNVNYLLIEGLQRSGYEQVARELRRRTLKLIAGQPDIYEYYHPETGRNPPDAASIFGWSAAVYIDLAIQAMQDTS